MPGGLVISLKQVPSGFLLLLRQLPLGLIFFLRLLWDLVVSSLVVMVDAWSPVQRFKPRILRVPIKSGTDLEITTLGNCITLTPGTTTLDVTPERDALIIHAMYADDADAVRKSVTDDLEPRLLKFMRVAGAGKGNA
jgi:multicomponent Na+:H+ antiporter subunit E